MAVKALVETPFRVATSKPAQKTYINTILFFITSTLLLGLSALAYGLFYFNYVPQIGIERVVHLQYGDGPHPYGIVSLSSDLIAQQPYDVRLTLHVPRSPPNIEAGNFMLELLLLSPTFKPIMSTIPTHSRPMTTLGLVMASVKEGDVLFSSRRSTLLRYTSRLVSLSERLAALPLYILGMRKESEVLSVPMAELVEFPKGWKNVPGFAMLELQAGQNIQVYDLRLHFTARFGGLRWWMYNYRVLSAVVGTGVFWGSSSTFALVAWLVLKLIFAPKEVPKDSIKEEGIDSGATQSKIKEEAATDDEPDLSDTPRTFPTYGRQAPLRYEPKVKDEADGEENILDETAILPLAAEADDEDDDVVGYRGVDSGLGTSYSEGGGRSSIARRRSKGKENA